MKTWKCEVCGYIHSGAEPPPSCPVCGAVCGDTTGAGMLKEIIESGRQISEFPELADMFPSLASPHKEKNSP